MAEVYFIDGQALTPSSFSKTDPNTGQYIPKLYTGTYGTNGFYLNFSDNSATTATTLGKDSSGNNNNWTPNAFSVAAGSGNDSLVDSPTNYGTDTGLGAEVRGNYCTLNPLALSGTLSNGNLDYAGSSSANRARSTWAVSTGKWYWEVTNLNVAGVFVGVIDPNEPLSNQVGQTAISYGVYGDGSKYSNNVSTAYASSWLAVGAVCGVALDMDNGTISYFINGVSQGVAFSGLSGIKQPALSQGTNNASVAVSCNFGQRPFAYAAPSGFKALCTHNLPTPAVVQSNTAFNAVAYTGNGSTQSITGFAFSPDFIWFKARNNTYSHALVDVVRGGTKVMFSDGNYQEVTSTGGVTAFNSTGFDITADPSTANSFNANGTNIVAWAWDAGTATVTNNSGSIASQVRANPAAGFSIVTFTAASGTNNFSVGHGLDSTPSMVIVKSRSNGIAPWYVYHSSLAANNYLRLNTSNATASDTDQWGAGMTSTVIGLRAGYSTVASTETVAYCFAEIPGFSAFGRYTGNASTDGPFVFTGFRPAFLLLKNASTADYDWLIYDSVRDTYNVTDLNLRVNRVDIESSQAANYLDLLSNGFKIRGDSVGSINPAQTIIYAAFAEQPFKYARAR
jgi:hypothetical protein